MSGQTPAGWYPDPQDETQVRYWDGGQWTENRSPKVPEAPVPVPSGAPGPPVAVIAQPVAPAQVAVAKKIWFSRHKFLTAMLAVFAVIVVMVIASNSGGGTTTASPTGGGQHATKDKPSTPSDDKPSNSGQTVPGSGAFGTTKLPLQNGDWRLDSIQVKGDGLGGFGGVARITYTGDDQQGGDNLFKVTLFKGTNLVGTLDGAANTVKPGTTVTVDMISLNSDKYVPGPYKYDFQNEF